MRYEIKGDSLPVVICELENGESMITESGAMSWMSPNMKMETSSNGGVGKVFGRILWGKTIFLSGEKTQAYQRRKLPETVPCKLVSQ